MEETNKISVSQLFILLFLSRAFSLVAYSPAGKGGGGDLTLITTALSGAVQLLALAAGLYLCRRGTGVSPLITPGSGFFRLQSGLYWLCCLVVCVYTAVNFIAFMTAVVYDHRHGWLVAVTFVAAGALAACQGLEGLARGGGILAVLLGLGCAVIALGLWQQYDWLNFTLRLLPPGDTIQGACHGLAMNGELFALLLLLPYLRQAPKALPCAGWVGSLTLAAGAVQLMTMLALGSYGAMKPFPVFTAVTSAGFRSFQRLDPVFLVIWVTLGLVKLSVFLSLASGLSAGLFFRPWGGRWVWGNGLVVVVLALVLWTGPEGWMDQLHRWLAAGTVTFVGVLLLPLAGKLLDKRRKEG